MLSRFLVSLLKTPYPISPLLLLANPPTPISLSWHSSTLDEGTLLPWMYNKAIFCYICIWSHGSLHVYSLVGGLVLGALGVGTGWFILLFFIWGPNPFSFVSPSPNFSIGFPCSVWWLAVSICICIGSGKASQRTAISGSCQQALPGISNSVWVWWDGCLGGAVSGWPFLQSLPCTLFLNFL